MAAPDAKVNQLDQHVAPGFRGFAAMMRSKPLPRDLAVLRSKEFWDGIDMLVRNAETPRIEAQFGEDQLVNVNDHVTGICINRKEPLATKRALYFIHSGALMCGYVKAEMLGCRVKAADFNVNTAFSVEYRLCPEAKLQELVDDLVAGYLWLLAQGFSDDQVIVTGISGGGLGTLYLLSELNRLKYPLPRTAVASVPHGVGIHHTEGLLPMAQWPSIIADLDPFARPDACMWQYLEVGDSAEVQRTASKLLSVDAFRGVSTKVFMCVGATELIVTANQQLAFILAKAGVDVTFKIWPGGVHATESFLALGAPEAEKARRIMAEWTLKAAA